MARSTREQQMSGCAVGTVALWTITGLFYLWYQVLPDTSRGLPIIEAVAYFFPREVAILGSVVVGAIAVGVAASRRDWIELLCLGIISGLGFLGVEVVWLPGVEMVGPLTGQTWNALIAAVFGGDPFAPDHPFIVTGAFLLVVLIPLTALSYGQAVGDTWRGRVHTAIGLLVALTIVVAMHLLH